ncbi:MAG: hypothetical protein FJX74_25555 [Armatimonadetes bacterium]|nr:hypothetical protein [Armatimonadota bacterium]
MRRIKSAGLNVPGVTRFMAAAMLAVCGAPLVSAEVSAQPTSGTPIQGTAVGLDHEPEGLRIDVGRTDARGNVTVRDLAPGRYTVFLGLYSTQKGMLRVTVTDDNVPPTIHLVSEPIQPGRAGGSAYVLDRTGQRLAFVIDKPSSPGRPGGPGGQITINVSEWDINNDGLPSLSYTGTVTVNPGMRINDPIPGVDVVVKRRPPGALITTTSDADGRFSVRVSEPGQYTLSTACKSQSACARFIPSSDPDAACGDDLRRAGSGCLPYTVSLTASGVPLRPSPDGTFEFTVDGARGPIVISGRVTANKSEMR